MKKGHVELKQSIKKLERQRRAPTGHRHIGNKIQRGCSKYCSYGAVRHLGED